MSYRVVTHSGKSHLDEVLGIVFISIFKDELPTEILRVHPEKAAEMVANGETGSDIFYVDCGLKFNIEENLFDHHQSGDLGCAALLIFESLFPELLESKLHDLVKLVSDVDTKGPTSLEDFSKNSPSISYFGFTQKLVLREFENSPLEVINLYRAGIISMLSFEKDRTKAKEWILEDGNISIETVDGINVLVYNDPPPVEISSAVKSVDGDIIDENNISISYSFDKEDPSIRTLFRTLQGDKLVDFTQSVVENTKFCHKSGFLLKFIPKDSNEWINIVKGSKK